MVVLSGEQPKGFLEWIQFLFPFLPPVISILIILIGLILSFVIFANAVIKCFQISGFNTSQITTMSAFIGLLFGIGCKRVIKDILFGVFMATEDILHPFDFICVKNI